MGKGKTEQGRNLILPCIQMSKMRFVLMDQPASVRQHLARRVSGVSECIWV
jgi:hypothetical protein